MLQFSCSSFEILLLYYLCKVLYFKNIYNKKLENHILKYNFTIDTKANKVYNIYEQTFYNLI